MLLDLYPARLAISGHDGATRVLDQVRVIVEGGIARAVGQTDVPMPEGASPGAEQAHPFTVEAYGVVAGRPQLVAVPYSLTMTDGTTWQVNTGEGCGCGRPLKRVSRRQLLAYVGGVTA